MVDKSLKRAIARLAKEDVIKYALTARSGWLS